MIIVVLREYIKQNWLNIKCSKIMNKKIKACWCGVFTGGEQQHLHALSLCESSHRWAWTGLLPPSSLLDYRLSCAVLQKHLNLRWQECVRLISSTVAPSSGSLLHNTQLHRKSWADTLKHNRCRLRGAVPVCPAHCHNLLCWPRRYQGSEIC